MSIYATLWEIRVERHEMREDWVTVIAQGVPAHIGHPSHYPQGDPYGDFLPPVVDLDREALRAVVFVAEGREDKDGQRYVDPLLVLTGQEYAAIRFADLLERLQAAVRKEEA